MPRRQDDSARPKRKLTKRQAAFVKNAADPKVKSNTEAAVKAGYAKKNARITAAKNLTKSNIFKAIEKRKERLAELADVTEKQILGATAEIAFASIEDSLDDKGYLDYAKAKKNGSASLIKKLTRTPTKYGEVVSVEFYPKDSAQNRLGEYLGMKKADQKNDADVTEVAKRVAERLVKEHGWPEEQAQESVAARYDIPPATISNAIN